MQSEVVPTASIGLIAELREAWACGDIQRLSGYFAPDYDGIDVGEATPHRGPEGVGRSITRYLSAFPDLNLVVDETLVDRSRLVLTWTARGTHRGSLMNIPATGRQVCVRGVAVLTLKGDRVQHGVYIWDVAGLLRAIGLLPELR